jgi:hypothetical protein
MVELATVANRMALPAGREGVCGGGAGSGGPAAGLPWLRPANDLLVRVLAVHARSGGNGPGSGAPAAWAAR